MNSALTTLASGNVFWINHVPLITDYISSGIKVLFEFGSGRVTLFSSLAALLLLLDLHANGFLEVSSGGSLLLLTLTFLLLQSSLLCFIRILVAVVRFFGASRYRNYCLATSLRPKLANTAVRLND